MSKFLFIAFLMFQACSQAPKPTDNKADIASLAQETSCISLSETETKGGLLYYTNKPFTGKVCSNFPEGQVHTETSFKNGIKEGEWKVFFANGNLEKQGVLTDGKDDKEYVEYYENGQLKYQYLYEKGIKIGTWKSWYEDGQKYTERNFSKNMLHGKVLVLDEQGRLAKEYDYLHGKLVSKQMHFKSWEE